MVKKMIKSYYSLVIASLLLGCSTTPVQRNIASGYHQHLSDPGHITKVSSKEEDATYFLEVRVVPLPSPLKDKSNDPNGIKVFRCYTQSKECRPLVHDVVTYNELRRMLLKENLIDTTQAVVSSPFLTALAAGTLVLPNEEFKDRGFAYRFNEGLKRIVETYNQTPRSNRAPRMEEFVLPDLDPQIAKDEQDKRRLEIREQISRQTDEAHHTIRSARSAYGAVTSRRFGRSRVIETDTPEYRYYYAENLIAARSYERMKWMIRNEMSYVYFGSLNVRPSIFLSQALRKLLSIEEVIFSNNLQQTEVDFSWILNTVVDKR